MTIQESRWLVRPRLPAEAEKELASYPPVLRQILYNRGYHDQESARRFLKAAPPEHTDPFRLLGMEAAVDRILSAIHSAEPIVIYGDYDADGVTATALMVETLGALGAQVNPYFPNRFEEGYGLNVEAVEQLHQDGVRLVITVDCGIRALEEAARAQALGLDLIITDHHQPGTAIPPAQAVINPKLPGDPYPDKNLSGVGVAFKLACALLAREPTATLQPESLLDLVALGTVADLVPLRGENRTLVRSGLSCIHTARRQGLRSLIGVSGLRDPSKISATDIGYILGPRLNAAGRLTSARAAYELLLARDVQQAGRLAQQLDNQNRQRQQLTRDIETRAEQLALERDREPLLLFAAHPEFNSGVIGLAAARLVSRYYRPAIVASQDDSYTRASCRSIPEFHITAALDRCADLLVRHGGHAMAAGFTVRNDKLQSLIERLDQIAREQLEDQELARTYTADAEVELSDLTWDLLEQLKDLQPTGTDNPEALFVSRNVTVRNVRRVGREGAHLKLSVTDGGQTLDAIAFQQGHWAENLPSRVDLLYTFEVNEYQGRISPQLNVRDINTATS